MFLSTLPVRMAFNCFLANVDKVIDLQISRAVLDRKTALMFHKLSGFNCLNFNYYLWPTDL